ncbi:MAG: energy transducer TonB [bacterium]
MKAPRRPVIALLASFAAHSALLAALAGPSAIYSASPGAPTTAILLSHAFVPEPPFALSPRTSNRSGGAPGVTQRGVEAPVRPTRPIAPATAEPGATTLPTGIDTFVYEEGSKGRLQTPLAAGSGPESAGAENTLRLLTEQAHDRGHPSSDWLPAYKHDLVSRIESHKRYPLAARRMRLEGNASVSFRVGRNGESLDAGIVDSSGSTLLDTAALEAVRASAPWPPFPPLAGQQAIAFQVTLSFRMK